MANFDSRLACNFNDLLSYLDRGIISGSASATLEEQSEFNMGEVRCAVRIYERYSILGGNRLSLSLTLFGTDGDVYISASASGGSQALFFKINTFGEESFLDCVRSLVDDFVRGR